MKGFAKVLMLLTLPAMVMVGCSTTKKKEDASSQKNQSATTAAPSASASKPMDASPSSTPAPVQQPMSGDPLDLTVTVTGICNKMVQHWPQLTGDPLISPCGDAVALRCNGIDIIVNNKRTQVLSPDVFTNFGLDVQKMRLLVVKSTQHFYAGYAPIASEIIYMAAPGAIAPIMTDIPFTRVNLHKYPWVDEPFA